MWVVPGLCFTLLCLQALRCSCLLCQCEGQAPHRARPWGIISTRFSKPGTEISRFRESSLLARVLNCWALFSCRLAFRRSPAMFGGWYDGPAGQPAVTRPTGRRVSGAGRAGPPRPTLPEVGFLLPAVLGGIPFFSADFFPRYCPVYG